MSVKSWARWTAFLFSVIFIYNLQKHRSLIYYSSPNTYRAAENRKKPICVLPRLNPWDERLMPYLSPDWDPLKNCNVTRIMHTELKDGMLRQLKNSTLSCFSRCLYSVGEKSFGSTHWSKMKRNERYRMKCDFAEVFCTGGDGSLFRYVHSQIVRPEKKHFQTEDNKHPSILIFVLDGVSASSAIRSASETVHVLRHHYAATFFYYHNKVGDNSRPNGIAMFSGSRTINLDRKRFWRRSVSEVSDSCERGLIKDETITYDFIKQKYVAIIAEDWGGSFLHPNCTGYGTPPSDHYASPLMLRTIKDVFEKDFYGGECQARHHKILDYVSKFLETYNTEAKFMVVWLSEPAHDYFNGLFRVDRLFANFFRKHAGHLKNSFVFVMGDHGLHYTEPRLTPVGYMEDNNPLLMIAVPQHLRFNRRLMDNLLFNARRHTSHYDIYATLYDIAHIAPLRDFKKWDKHDFRSELGDARGSIRARSLFRPITYDRTCFEMQIPDEICLCQRLTRVISNKNKRVRKAAQQLVVYLNEQLVLYDYRKLCRNVSFSEVYRAEQFVGHAHLKLIVVVEPSKGKIEAELRKDGYMYEVIETSVVRVDNYGDQGHCTRNAYIRSFCYCKEQLKK